MVPAAEFGGESQGIAVRQLRAQGRPRTDQVIGVVVAHVLQRDEGIGADPGAPLQDVRILAVWLDPLDRLDERQRGAWPRALPQRDRLRVVGQEVVGCGSQQRRIEPPAPRRCGRPMPAGWRAGPALPCFARRPDRPAAPARLRRNRRSRSGSAPGPGARRRRRDARRPARASVAARRARRPCPSARAPGHRAHAHSVPCSACAAGTPRTRLRPRDGRQRQQRADGHGQSLHLRHLRFPVIQRSAAKRTIVTVSATINA